jgi:PhnB protein
MICPLDIFMLHYPYQNTKGRITMKVSPYLHFNGNCAEAIALYEKAFKAEAEILRYSDAPPSEGYDPPPGTENFVMHACLSMGENKICLCDLTPDMPSSFSNGIAVFVNLDSADAVKASFFLLKEGGSVGMEPMETFWSKCFCSFEDKFGVNWMLSFE